MAEVELRMTADLDQALNEVRGFSKEYAKLVTQIEKPLRQVNMARDLERDLEASGKAVQSARVRLATLQRELINTESPTERLKESFREATKELQRLERAEAVQANQLARVRSELKGAGVDTTRLAAEQRRLNAEMTRAQGDGRQDAAARGIRDRAAALKQQAIAQRQANIEAARDNLGINRLRAIQGEIQGARQQYELLRTSGKLSTKELAVAQQQLTQRIRDSKSELQALSSAQGGGALAGIGAGRLAGVAGGVVGAAALAGQYAAAIDPIKNMRAQLDLATDSQEELNKALADSARIADAAGAPLTDTAELYAKLVPPVKELGGSQQDAANSTEAFALGLRISGANAQQSAAAMQQYVQALNRGVFQAEEFNSVSDGNIRLIRAFAEELGVTVGEFRNMVLAGEITSEMLIDLSNRVLPALRAEAEQMPETWAAATTRLTNSFQQLLGKFDESTGASQKLIDKINSLATSLDLLGSGSAKKAAVGVGNVATEAAKAVPLLNTMALAVEHLGRVTGMGTFAENAEEMVQEEVKVYDFRAERLAAHHARVRDMEQQAGEDGKAIKEQQLKDTKAALQQQIAAERKAASELAKAKQAQLDTQKRYKDALASLAGGGQASEPSFAQATALKAGARQALQGGDVEKAKQQAQAALEVLKQLKDAGKNTYGFAGMIKELKSIEDSADSSNVEDAQKQLKQTQDIVAQTKAALEELKDIKVQPTLDAEAQQALLDQMARLADQAKIIMTIPVTYKQSDFDPVSGDYILQQPNLTPPGFADGGWTGPGGKYQPAGVVHAGEHVQPQRIVREPGALSFLERIRRDGFRSTLASLRDGYAEGGLVGPRSLPAIPPIPPSLLEASGGSAESLGTLVLQLGGQQFSVKAPRSTAEELNRTARKLGATSR
ncbi:tape measure protein [Pseudomonas sp. SO81]|uniref:tape measure protein n=1 Tax=Pseudomonas sp. SO81 TaxID=2983246 RepID=UPI0025A3D8E3|nr:tape measure protein [Pseudomonas sp. SO81]WJN60937.1 hypothetical protein OH686_19505 [Pseudomonas sp. SO81]